MSCCRLYWSDPGTGSVSYIHLSTRERRVLVPAEYSPKLYGVTVFQVLTAFRRHFVIILSEKKNIILISFSKIYIIVLLLAVFTSWQTISIVILLFRNCYKKSTLQTQTDLPYFIIMMMMMMMTRHRATRDRCDLTHAVWAIRNCRGWVKMSDVISAVCRPNFTKF